MLAKNLPSGDSILVAFFFKIWRIYMKSYIFTLVVHYGAY